MRPRLRSPWEQRPRLRAPSEPRSPKGRAKREGGRRPGEALAMKRARKQSMRAAGKCRDGPEPRAVPPAGAAAKRRGGGRFRAGARLPECEAKRSSTRLFACAACGGLASPVGAMTTDCACRLLLSLLLRASATASCTPRGRRPAARAARTAAGWWKRVVARPEGAMRTVAKRKAGPPPRKRKSGRPGEKALGVRAAPWWGATRRCGGGLSDGRAAGTPNGRRGRRG